MMMMGWFWSKRIREKHAICAGFDVNGEIMTII